MEINKKYVISFIFISKLANIGLDKKLPSTFPPTQQDKDGKIAIKITIAWKTISLKMSHFKAEAA